MFCIPYTDNLLHLTRETDLQTMSCVQWNYASSKLHVHARPSRMPRDLAPCLKFPSSLHTERISNRQHSSKTAGGAGLPSILCMYIIWATSWENLFMPYGNNKGTDQPAHLCSLISTFVICNTSTCYSWNFKTLVSLISWAGRLES